MSSSNYSGAYYAITMASAKTFVLYFRRTDTTSPTAIAVVSYYGTYLTSAEIVAKGNNSTATGSAPP